MRKSALGRIVFGLGMLAACVFAADGSRASELTLVNIAHRAAANRPLRIIAFGSSSTEGVGASSPLLSYPADLQRDLSESLRNEQVIVVNRGIGGQDADDMLRRMDQDALAPRPDLVIWQTGSNDPLRGVPLDRFKEETRTAVLKLRNAGIDVMLLEPQWCRLFDRTPGSAAYRDAVREVGEEFDVPVIRRSSLMKTWLKRHLVTYDQLFAPDGLHMADGGYALLAKDIAGEILEGAGIEPRPALAPERPSRPVKRPPATDSTS